MSPELGLVIMMNNYFHDVATASLVASGFALWVMLKRLDDNAQAAANDYFLRIHTGMTRLARFSLAWIILGGIPRVIFYQEFEWANAVGKLQVTALIVKHIIAFAFVGAGAFLWFRLNQRVKAIRAGRS